MAFGVKSKTPFTLAVSSESEMEDVPNDSTRTLTGFATPMTYDNWISHLLAKPAATTCFAAHQAAYAADLSTFDGSFPENAPPPCLPIPPYVSTMIFLPVNPASAYGPPGSANLPVPLTTK